MKHLAIVGACALLILTTGLNTAYAGHKHKKHERKHFTGTVKVTQVVPIYRTVRIAEPREECYEKEVYYRNNGYVSATPMIAGGVIGGILGNQFGRGNGKTVMTVAGTVLGGSIGRDIGHNNQTYTQHGPQTETHCEIINDYREEEQIDGYRVTYRYHGKKFNTTLPYHPGKRVKLDVSIRPYE